MLRAPPISKYFSPKFIEEAKEAAEKQGLPLRVMFQDEARFGRINDPRRCWAPKGIRPQVCKQFAREYTYLYGAFSPNDGRADFLILPAMDTVCMNLFLQELAARYKNEFLCVFWDGAACHSPGKLMLPENVLLEKLPPYCPDLNPSENIWDDMRETFFHNSLFNSMEAVEGQLVSAANFYENKPDLVKSITGWEWITSTL